MFGYTTSALVTLMLHFSSIEQTQSYLIWTLVGAGLALVADAIAQLPGSQIILPLNAVIAILGGPIIISLVLQQARYSQGFKA